MAEIDAGQGAFISLAEEEHLIQIAELADLSHGFGTEDYLLQTGLVEGAAGVRQGFRRKKRGLLPASAV